MNDKTKSCIPFFHFTVKLKIVKYVYDCAGNLKFIEQCIIDYNASSIKLSDKQYSHVVDAMLDPNVIVELNKTCSFRYYYRSKVFEKSLVGVQFANGIWKTIEYFDNVTENIMFTTISKHLKDGRIDIFIQKEFEDRIFEDLFV